MLVKAARVFTAIISCFLIGLPILGFAGLKQFLLEHGVFEDECRAGINNNLQYRAPIVLQAWNIIQHGIGGNLDFSQDAGHLDLGADLTGDVRTHIGAPSGARLGGQISGKVDLTARITATDRGIGGDIGGGIGGNIGGNIGDIIGTIGGGGGGGIGGRIGHKTSEIESAIPTSTNFNCTMTASSNATRATSDPSTQSEDESWANTWWTNTWWTPTSEEPKATRTIPTQQYQAQQPLAAELGGSISGPPVDAIPDPPYTDPKYGMICMDRMVKFDSLISLGLLASAVATLIAYFVLDYIGHVCGSISGCLLVAGGVYVLSVPSTEQVFDSIDRYFWGFLLLSLGAPFVVVSSMDAASVVQRRPMLMLFTLFAVLELGSGFWTLWCYIFQPKTTEQLFNQYLAVPCVLILFNLLVAPFSSQTPAGNIERLLQRVFVVPATGSSDYLSDAAQFLWEQSDHPKWGILLNQMSTLWFWMFSLYYVINILTFDLYYSSGIEYAWILDGIDVSYNFLYIRPLLSALTAFAVYFMIVHFKITTIQAFIVVSSLTLLIQLLELTRNWSLVALLIGPTRVALVSLGLGFTLKIFGSNSFGFVYSAVMILSGVSDLFLPPLVSWIWTSITDFIYVMGTVCLSTLFMALFMVWRLYSESREIECELLRREASAAEQYARQIPNLV